MPALMPVAEHLADCLAPAKPTAPLVMSLDEAAGTALAAPVGSSVALPGFDNSAMDGYAVHPDDVAEAAPNNPIPLTVIDDIPAGRYRDRPFPRGTAVRIMTGAPVPPQTRAVVQVELTDAGTQVVQVYAPVGAGANIRHAGEDVTVGEQLLEAGDELDARRIGLLAAAGSAHVEVWPKPRVLVLATGSELVEPGNPLLPGQIYESNARLLAAAVVEAGGVPVRPQIVVDEADALLETLATHLPEVDLVVTSGGVSAGAYDTVKEVLRTTGTVDFRKVAMQPGMPQGCGTLSDGDRRVPIVTLPGNPVSTFVSFEVFGRPVLRRIGGHSILHRRVVPARVAHAWASPPAKLQYARVTLQENGSVLDAYPVGAQRSHLVADLAASDALALVGPELTGVEVGDVVDCMLLS